MTYLVYLDEQEGTINGEKYTAVIGFRVRLADINNIRQLFYPALNALIDKRINGSEPSEIMTIHRLPLLHGSHFLPDYQDHEKFEVLDILSDSIEPFDFNFLRVGYFDRSMPQGYLAGDRSNILSMALISVGFSLWDKPDDDFIIVSEIDKEALKKKIESTFNDSGMYFVVGTDNVSFNVRKLVGHFYAPKHDLGCQIADVYNYCCLQKTTGTSEFQRKLSTYYDRFKDRYLVNQLIWFNDDTRNFNLEQINPLSSKTQKYRTCPFSGEMKIIPNDDFLETAPIPPIK